MGGGIEFSGAQFAGRGIGGKDGKMERGFYSLLGTVVLCLSVQVYIAWRDLCTARSAMRAEIKKVSFSDLLFSLLTYLTLFTLFPEEGLESYALRSDMYLFVYLLVRSFVR